MNVAIVGSRGFRPLSRVWDYVAKLPSDAHVISGGAVGVDREAEHAARLRGLQITVFLPDWAKYGRRAGMLRNRQIVEAADLVVAFWDGASRGTASSLAIAHELKKPVEVISP